MAVLLYQLAIVVTLVLTRVVAPARLSTAALIWTVLTLLNLFWPPLIILQLLVIWGTFALLGGLRRNSDNGGSQSGQPKSKDSSASAIQASHDGNNPVSVLDRINTAANATSRSVESAASGLDLLDKNIEEAKAKQIARQKIEEAVYIRELHENAAEEEAQRQKALEKRLSADPELKQLYIENYNRLQPVMQQFNERHVQNKLDAPSPPVSSPRPREVRLTEQGRALAALLLSKQQPQPPAATGSSNATVGLPAQAGESSSRPDVERQEIMEAAIALKIPLLLHFTRARNLESIFKHGLCSNATSRVLGIKPHTNDPLRLDGHTDAISLSISFPNYKMFYKYRQEEPNEDWAVLVIGPGILWQKKCAFCQRNAADHRIRQRSAFDLMNADALRGMFEELEGIPSRQEQRLEGHDPTDPQAEVLVFETIEPDLLEYVAFESDEIMSKYSHLMDNRRMWRVGSKNRGIFASRSFVRKAYN
ncbi:DarT ssDNA thymidine ADP-ribosyltransferase family protein [Microvirga sp. P5_D2]